MPNTYKELSECKDTGKQFLELLDDCWVHDYGKMVVKGKRVLTVELHTGGWSENEEIMAIVERSMFNFFWWQKSTRGGHYYYKVNTFGKWKWER